MRKDKIVIPLLPFTEDEEAALSERLSTMDAAALGHYVDSARNSLGNNALDPSWRPRIEFGLARAEAALVIQTAAEAAAAAEVVEPPPPVAAKKATKASKAAASKAAASEAEASEVEGSDSEASDVEA